VVKNAFKPFLLLFIYLFSICNVRMILEICEDFESKVMHSSLIRHGLLRYRSIVMQVSRMLNSSTFYREDYGHP